MAIFSGATVCQCNLHAILGAYQNLCFVGKGISLKLQKVALIDSDDKSFKDRDVIFPFSKMFL